MVKIKITITEEPNTVQVEYQGQTHTGTWDDEENVNDVVGDENILRAALLAWAGEESPWEITPEELEEASQGHWSA